MIQILATAFYVMFPKKVLIMK